MFLNFTLKVKEKVAWLYLTLWDAIDCSLPGSLVHGILQARILEWVAYPFSRGSSQPRNQIKVSCIAGKFFISWATHFREFKLSPKCSRKPALFSISISWNTVSPLRCRVHAYLHISWDRINPFALEDDLLSKALEVHIYISNVKIRVRVPSILMFSGGDWANRTTNHMGLWTWFRQEKEIQAMISFSWQLVQEDICLPWEDICFPCWVGAQISPFGDRIWTFRARMRIK